MHRVHVHLGKEWCGCSNDQWNYNLVGLVGLTNVTSAHVSRDVMTHEWPPILLGDESMCCIVALVSDIIMHGMDVTSR